MITLGIDTGFATTGWAIIDKKGSYNFELKDYGAIFTDVKSTFEERLEILFRDLNEIITLYSPTDIAIESLFYFKNQKTVMSVAQARGVILLAAQLKNLKIFNYTPLQVKNAVTGYGKAEKLQVQKMIKNIFKLDELPKPDDVADAIAIAYCHSNTIV